MKFIRHYSKFGDCNFIGFMESKGIAYARAYHFDDDKTTMYLDQLSVSECSRNQGIGTELQKIRESIAKGKGFKYTSLWVKKGTWMRKWYERRGYKYFKPYKDENAIWLRKVLT